MSFLNNGIFSRTRNCN